MADAAWYAARRAKGLCVNCPMPSGKFWRCACCREELRTTSQPHERARRRKFRTVLNARARQRYQEQKAA